MTGFQNCRFLRQQDRWIGVDENHRQVVRVVLILVGLFVVQLLDDPGDALFGLRQLSRPPEQRIGVLLAIRVDRLDDERHHGRIVNARFGEIVSRPLPNRRIGVKDGFFDLGFGKSHGSEPPCCWPFFAA